MQLPDLINAVFEFGIGLLAIGNIKAILRDKCVKGVFWPVQLWAMAWGYYNLFYYWHLDQYLSWTAGLTITATNTAWVILCLYYMKNDEQRRRQTAAQATAT